MLAFCRIPTNWTILFQDFAVQLADIGTATPAEYARANQKQTYDYANLFYEALRGGTTSLNESKPFHAGSTGVTPALGT